MRRWQQNEQPALQSMGALWVASSAVLENWESQWGQRSMISAGERDWLRASGKWAWDSMRFSGLLMDANTAFRNEVCVAGSSAKP
jgi:hypothetical protein